MKLIRLISKRRWIKYLLIFISSLALLFYWFFSTLGIVKGYPIANEEGEIISMIAPSSLRNYHDQTLIESYKNSNKITEDVKLYRAWKKSWLKIGMWSYYINDKEYWNLEYIELDRENPNN